MPEYALPTFLLNGQIFHLKSKQDCKNSNQQHFFIIPNQFATYQFVFMAEDGHLGLKCLAQEHMISANLIRSPAQIPIRYCIKTSCEMVHISWAYLKPWHQICKYSLKHLDGESHNDSNQGSKLGDNAPLPILGVLGYKVAPNPIQHKEHQKYLPWVGQSLPF